MNTNFFIDGRWFKTPCKTVLNADTFRVKFFTGAHIITAFVADKCYFDTIDNIVLSDIKCDFYFGRNYHKPKEFLSNLYETFTNFLNTSIPFTERHFLHSTDDVIRRILENLQMKDESSEIIFESAEAKDTTEKELEKLEKEHIELEDTHIDDIKKFKAKTAINSLHGITSAFETGDDFHRLAKTLIISLFKAIGTQDTMKLSFTIANDIVFFNYKGTEYKYYPSQCKIFKKRGRKYQRINWKDFPEENNPDGQKQSRGRSPPFTPVIRSTKMIND